MLNFSPTSCLFVFQQGFVESLERTVKKLYNDAIAIGVTYLVAKRLFSLLFDARSLWEFQ